MTKEKVFVYDEPLVKTQTFKVNIPDKGRFLVERKEILRQQHNMGCTDGMKEGETQTILKHKVWIEDIDPVLRERVINEVEKEVEKISEGKKKW